MDRNVEFMRQSREFTCGPACLVMAMHHFEESVPLSMELEIDVWREANMVESRGTSPFGLAVSAAYRGFEVRIQNSSRGLPLKRTLRDRFPGADMENLDFFHRLTMEKCRDLDIPVHIAAITLDALRKVLDSGRLPILLTSTRIGEPDEHIPHWVLLTGYDHESFTLNNPYVPKGRNGQETISNDLLALNLGYEGEQSMVVVGPRSLP